MPRRYTLSECYIVLDVDPKTFRSWLKKAGMEPQVSKADPRVKYLTEDQVRSLASDHERDPDRARRAQEVIPPNAYKTLQDQVKELEQRQAGGHAELLESLAAVETRQRQVSEELGASTTSQVDALRQAVDQGRQQHESLVELLNQQAVLVDQVRVDLAGQREDVRVVRAQSEALEARQVHALQEVRQAFALDQRQATDELRQEMGKLLEQRVREVYQAIEDLSKEGAADLATMTERLDREAGRVEQFTTQFDAARIMALGAKPRVDAQDQVIAELRAQLQREGEVRASLAEQVAALLVEKTEGRQRVNPRTLREKIV